jgi:hypothetical protein
LAISAGQWRRLGRTPAPRLSGFQYGAPNPTNAGTRMTPDVGPQLRLRSLRLRGIIDDLRSIPRSHCTAAPATRIEPSSAWLSRPTDGQSWSTICSWTQQASHLCSTAQNTLLSGFQHSRFKTRLRASPPAGPLHNTEGGISAPSISDRARPKSSGAVFDVGQHCIRDIRFADCCSAAGYHRTWCAQRLVYIMA